MSVCPTTSRYREDLHSVCYSRISLAHLVVAQSYTVYGHMRPFGTAVLLAAVDQTGPQLYMIEPSGISYGYYGVAVGKGRQAAKTEIEKLKLKEMTCMEAIQHVAKM